MDAKSQLKKLIAGEISFLVDGTYADDDNICQVKGNIVIYRQKKAGEDISKLRPKNYWKSLKKIH